MSTPNRLPACFAIASMLAGLGTAVAQPLPAPGSATPPTTTPPKAPPAGPTAPPKAQTPVGPTAPPKAAPTTPAPKAGPPSKAAPTAEAREAAAKAYFERGSAYYAAGDYLLARAEFAAGYELSGRPLFLFNMAECSRLNGDLDQARSGYERYLREAPTGSQVGLAKERLSAMKQPKPEPKPAAGPVYGPRPATPVASGPQIGPQPPVLGPQPPTKSSIGSSTECTAEGGCASSGRTKRLAGLGVGGGGVLLIFAGMYYWRRAANLGSEVTDACANGCDWATVSDDYEASKSAERRQWTMLGFGTAALAAGGVLYWLGMKEEAAAAKVVIVPREGGAAVSWGGRW